MRPTIRTAQYWPHDYNPLRYGALVEVLTQDATGCTVKGFDGVTWRASFDELQVLVQDEEGNNG